MAALTQEQETTAFILIREGDEQAKEQFVYFNQPLVGWVASRYRDKGLSWEELVSAGNVGLLQAVNRFDPSKGHKFSTFAVPWIEGEIKQTFDSAHRQKASQRRIMQTEHGVPLVFEQAETEAEDVVTDPPSEVVHDPLFDWADSSPTADVQQVEILNHEADKGERISIKDATSEGMTSGTGCAEWDNLRGEDPSSDPKPAGGLAINFAADQSTGVMGIDVGLVPALKQSIEGLKDLRQKQVLVMFLGLDGRKQHTFAEIGEALGVTAQRAHAIQKQAMVHLRKDPTLQMLFDLLT